MVKIIEKAIELEPRKVYLCHHTWKDNVGEFCAVEIPISQDEYEAIKFLLKEEEFETVFDAILFKKIKELQGDC